MTAAEIATRIPGARQFRSQWRAPAPCHGSRSASLSFRDGDRGGVLFHCFAGCRFESILHALDIDARSISAHDDHSRDRSVARPRPIPDAILAALANAATAYRRMQGIDDGERLVASDINAIRRTVATQLGITLPPIAWRAADSHTGGHERDPLWPIMLERAWFEVWIEITGDRPPVAVDDFASLGRAGVSAFIAAEMRAARDR